MSENSGGEEGACVGSPALTPSSAEDPQPEKNARDWDTTTFDVAGKAALGVLGVLRGFLDQGLESTAEDAEEQPDGGQATHYETPLPTNSTASWKTENNNKMEIPR